MGAILFCVRCIAHSILYREWILTGLFIDDSVVWY
jgi:hypothetical protein